jgi:branched-chain amino acid transport system substrate-binding protein
VPTAKSPTSNSEQHLKRFARFTATAALAAVAFSCAVRADIVIGVAVPSSGPKVDLGRAIAETVAAEIARINAAGGLNGETLTLITADDDCSSQGGAQVAADLIARKVAFVLGHPCSNAAMAAAQVYARHDILFVAVGARHPDLTAKRAGPTIFRLGGRDDRQVADTVAALAARLKGKRVAIVQDRTAYARGLATGIAAGLRNAGAANVVELPFVAGERQYAALISQIKTATTDAIYFAGFPAEAEIILTTLRATGVDALFIGCDALAEIPNPVGTATVRPAPAQPDLMRRLSITLQAWLSASRQAEGATPITRAFAALAGSNSTGDLPGLSFTIEGRAVREHDNPPKL